MCSKLYILRQQAGIKTASYVTPTLLTRMPQLKFLTFISTLITATGTRHMNQRLFFHVLLHFASADCINKHLYSLFFQVDTLTLPHNTSSCSLCTLHE
jgi:hypothetical protein